MKKWYIEDFCEDLNYTGIIVHVDENIDMDNLYEAFTKNHINHLYRFETVRENRFFYVENCDLQDIDTKKDITCSDYDNELCALLSEDYCVLQLKQEVDGRFYIEVNQRISS